MTAKRTHGRAFPIPDICRNTSILITVMIVELVAIVVTLLTVQSDYLVRLGKVSLYLQWYVLLTAAAICLLRVRLRSLPFAGGATAIFILSMMIFSLVEISTQWATAIDGLSSFDGRQFFARLGVVSIASGLLLWLMTLGGRIEHSSQAQAQAKVQALQSRIRPHFLFNSLNTIAELAATKDDAAEAAIDSLSLLFRASLEDVNKAHSLQAEIDLCERYLELERWRLGDRLAFKKTVSISSAQDWQVPKLILQPLIENAVVHGGDNEGQVEIELDVKETSNHLSLMVRNNNSKTESAGSGHGMALENIRERLFVLFDDQQSLRFREEQGWFQVILRIPKQIHINMVADT